MKAVDRVAAIVAAYKEKGRLDARTQVKPVARAKARQDIRDVLEEHMPHLLPLLVDAVRRDVMTKMINGEKL